MSNIQIFWQNYGVTRAMREALNDHKSFTLWFTGLSGAGKSTLAFCHANQLHAEGYRTYVLDGDNIRHGLCSDLKFQQQDRLENVRRVSEVAKLFTDAGVITFVALISPYEEDRKLARSLHPHGDFVEIFCNAGLEVCERRDVKGLYKKARAGLIKNFTGISSPYEMPINPDLEIDTSAESVETCINIIKKFLINRKLLQA